MKKIEIEKVLEYTKKKDVQLVAITVEATLAVVKVCKSIKNAIVMKAFVTRTTDKMENFLVQLGYRYENLDDKSVIMGYELDYILSQADTKMDSLSRKKYNKWLTKVYSVVAYDHVEHEIREASNVFNAITHEAADMLDDHDITYLSNILHVIDNE